MNKSFAKQLKLEEIYIIEDTYDKEEINSARSSRYVEDKGSTYVAFDGYPILEQLRPYPTVAVYDYRTRTYADPDPIDTNVDKIDNSVKDFKLCHVGSSYSTGSRNYIGNKIEVNIKGQDKTIHISLQSTNYLLEEAIIEKGIVKSECIFIPDGGVANTLVVKGGKQHERFLKEWREAKGLKTITLSKIPKGAVLDSRELVLGSFIYSTISINIDPSDETKISFSSKNVSGGMMLDTWGASFEKVKEKNLDVYYPSGAIYRLDGDERDSSWDSGLYRNFKCAKKISYVEGEDKYKMILPDFDKYLETHKDMITKSCLSNNWADRLQTPYRYSTSTSVSAILNFLKNNSFIFKTRDDITWFLGELEKKIIDKSSKKLVDYDTFHTEIIKLYYDEYLFNRVKISDEEKKVFKTRNIITGCLSLLN